MSGYSFTIYNPARAQTVANHTRRLRPDSLSLTDAAVSYEVDMPVWEAAQYLDNLLVLQVWVTRHGRIRKYRLATPTLTLDGVRFESAGLIVAFDDDEYAALWSTTSMEGWTPGRTSDSIFYLPERFEFDQNGRVQIAAKKNEKFSIAAIAGSAVGMIYTRVAPESSRKPLIIQTSWEFLAPTTWVGGFIRGDTFASIANIITPLAGSGAQQTGAFCEVFTASSMVGMQLYYNNAVPTLYIGETGDCYLRLVTVRIATSSTHMINTTIASGAFAAGVAIITPTTIAGIYVDQELVINSGAADSEMVVVTAVTATTFTATFAKAHAASANVRAIVIRDDEIIADMLNQVTTLNPTSGLSTSTVLVERSTQDLDQVEWINVQPSAVLAELAFKIRYAYGVNPFGQVFYHPKTSYVQAWMVRAGDIELARPVERLVNSVRVAYETTTGAPAVTAYSTDVQSTTQNGLTRRRTITIQSANKGEITAARTTALDDTKDRVVQSAIGFRRLFNRAGVEYPPDSVQPGDTITISNLPAGMAGINLRTFTVKEVGFDPSTSTPSVTPLEPMPSLDVLLAKLGDS